MHSNLTGKISLSNNFPCPYFKRSQRNLASVADQKHLTFNLYCSPLVSRVLKHLVNTQKNTSSSSQHPTHFSCTPVSTAPGLVLAMGGCGKGAPLPEQVARVLCWLLPESLLLPWWDGMVKPSQQLLVLSALSFLTSCLLAVSWQLSTLLGDAVLEENDFCGLTAARWGCCC